MIGMHRKTAIAITFAVLGVFLLIGGTHMFRSDGGLPLDQGSGLALPKPPTRCGSDDVIPTGTKEYCNRAYHFSLLYPQELEVTEHDEGHGAYTITFEDAYDQRGFQIFIVSYAGEQISEERFHRDIPSGVRTDVVEMTLAGAPGAAFYSEDVSLGKTYEMWFMYKGWLHEASTIAPFDTWMRHIMSTWRFLY